MTTADRCNTAVRACRKCSILAWLPILRCAACSRAYPFSWSTRR